ncbi:MAG: alpha/beta hydrolase [Thermoleophilaceae bacterium]
MSPARVQGAGVELAYDEAGSGPSLLLVHGTALTRLSWRETVEELGGTVRSIAYDRRGYGDSGAPEPYAGTTIEEQSEDAALLLNGLEVAPAVVCGHSAGAIVALDLLLRHPGLVSGAVLIEPPLLSLSPSGAETLSAIREGVEAAAREGGPEAGVEAFVESQDGPSLLDSIGADRAGAIRASARAAFADFGAANAWQFSRRELRATSAPVLVLRGSRSTPVYRDVAAAIAEVMGSAQLRELDAGHIGPLDDPAGVAAAIRELAAP